MGRWPIQTVLDILGGVFKHNGRISVDIFVSEEEIC